MAECKTIVIVGTGWGGLVRRILIVFFCCLFGKQTSLPLRILVVTSLPSCHSSQQNADMDKQKDPSPKTLRQKVQHNNRFPRIYLPIHASPRQRSMWPLRLLPRRRTRPAQKSEPPLHQSLGQRHRLLPENLHLQPSIRILGGSAI